MSAPSTPWSDNTPNSTPYSHQVINSTGWQKENLTPIPGQLLQEDKVSFILQQDGSSFINLE